MRQRHECSSCQLTEGERRVFADVVVLATPPIEAVRLVNHVNAGWSARVHGLQHEAITTVYAQAPAGFALPSALIALASDAQNPAQELRLGWSQQVTL